MLTDRTRAALDDERRRERERMTSVTKGLTALRALSINDEIIQSLAQLGVVSLVAMALSLVIASSSDDDDSVAESLAVPTLGLIRNLFQNYEFKSTLVLGRHDDETANDGGSNSSSCSLTSLLALSSRYRTNLQLQTQFCAVMAALYLRYPSHVPRVVNGLIDVVAATKCFPENVTLGSQYGTPFFWREGRRWMLRRCCWSRAWEGV